MRAKRPRRWALPARLGCNESERVTRSDDKSRLIVEIDTLEHYGHWPIKHTLRRHIWDRGNQGRSSSRPSHAPSRHDRRLSHLRPDGYAAVLIFYYDGVEIHRNRRPEKPRLSVHARGTGSGGPAGRSTGRRAPAPAYRLHPRVWQEMKLAAGATTSPNTALCPPVPRAGGDRRRWCGHRGRGSRRTRAPFVSFPPPAAPMVTTPVPGSGEPGGSQAETERTVGGVSNPSSPSDYIRSWWAGKRFFSRGLSPSAQPGA